MNMSFGATCHRLFDSRIGSRRRISLCRAIIYHAVEIDSKLEGTRERLPIFLLRGILVEQPESVAVRVDCQSAVLSPSACRVAARASFGCSHRSEERRVGKECRS